MAKIYVFRGIPASGKSSLAKRLLKDNATMVWVNKDNMRMFHNRVYSSLNEVYIRNMYRHALDTALGYGLDVVCDDAGLLDQHNFGVVEEFAKKYGAEIIINDQCLETPLEECIRRDSMRQNGVGADVIRTWFDRHIGYTPLVMVPSKKDCVILDIDGCAAKWVPTDSWENQGFGDPNDCVKAVVNSQPPDVEVVVVTGRTDTGDMRSKLMHWLDTSGFRNPSKIFMRPDGNRVRAGELKSEIVLKNILPEFNVVLAIDDDASVIQAYRQIGISTFQVQMNP